MFGHDECKPCRVTEPMWRSECERAGLDFVKVNTRKNEELASAMGIRMVPVVLVVRDGAITDMVHGMTNEFRIGDTVANAAGRK